MADVNNLLRQHNDILDLAHKISAYQNEAKITSDAFAISLLLGQLAGKLKIHMTTEDKFLYPSLLNHTDDNIRTLSRRFADEMGGIAKAFDNYKTTYMSAKEISTNPTAFLNETKLIIAAIDKRIAKENTELYPLI